MQTDAQQTRLAREREEEVAFPPRWEMRDGIIHALLILGFEGKHGELPKEIDVELIRVARDGSVLSRQPGSYSLDGFFS